MKRLAAFLIFLLAGSLVPAAVMAEGAVATIHIIASQSKTAQIPHATVEYHGEFWWDGGEICAPIHVVYDSGGDHGVCARPSGETDPEKLYEFRLEHITYRTWSSTEGLSVGDSDAMNVFRVTKIDLLFHTVTLEGLQDDFKVGLEEGQTVTVPGVPKAKVKLVSINVGILETTAKFEITYSQPIEADIVVYPYQTQEQAPGPAPSENQTNESPSTPQPFIDPTKVPAVMIVVGEHAAGADVAAGAKVGIAVQKWIDLVKEKGGDALIPELGGGFTAKLATFPVERLNADAMLDTEVTDPENLALVVYSVGGPAANQYSAMLNNRTDLPVRFVKENGKWYLVSKTGERWSGSYGVIMLIPASRDAYELKMNLMNGKFKIMDVLVAGLDRWGTYAACELLQGEFLKPVKGMKPDADLMTVITLQTQALAMFVDPFSIFEVGPDPTKVPTTAIIVDKNGRVVKVLEG